MKKIEFIAWFYALMVGISLTLVCGSALLHKCTGNEMIGNQSLLVMGIVMIGASAFGLKMTKNDIQQEFC
jgi:hypothetical protein